MSTDPFDDYDDEEEVDLDPGNKAPTGRVDRFKGEKGRTYRGALLLFPTLEASVISKAKKKAKAEKTEIDKDAVRAQCKKVLAAQAEKLGKGVDELLPHEKLDLARSIFKKIRAMYHDVETDTIGYVQSRIGLDGPEADAIWRSVGEEKRYYYTVLLTYPCNKKGELDKSALLRDSEVVPWRMGPKNFNRLIEIEEKLKEVSAGANSLATYDLELKCTNGQYQNFDIDFKGAAVWLKSKKLQAKILPEAVALYEKLVDIKKLTTPELKAKLNIGGGDSGEDIDDDMIDDDDDVDGVLEDLA